MPPPLTAPQQKKYHLTQEDVEQMRQLRALDPKKWTIGALADKFKCSYFFAQITCKNAAAGKEAAEKLQQIKEKWGPRKRMAREDRTKRKDLWGRER